MRVIVMHNGSPLGSVDLMQPSLAADEPSAVAVGELRAGPGYDAVREVVRAASAELWRLGFLGESHYAPLFAATTPNPGALGRAADLPLELRDEHGIFVPADYINIIERPDLAGLPVVVARFRLAPGAVGAPVPPGPRGGGGTRPDA